MIKNLKKIFILVMVMMIILPIQLIQVFATGIGETHYLQRGDRGFYSVQYNKDGKWIYITYELVYYIDGDGNRQIAYCLNPELDGVGWASGSIEGYNVQLTDVLSDVRIWRACINGYPYKTPSQLGVETNEDAYLATKQAIYCVLRGWSLDNIYQYYRAGQSTIDGQSLEDIQRRGTKVFNAIYNLVNTAYNSAQVPATANNIHINKIDSFKEDSKTDYYSQEYKVTSDISMENYTIVNLRNFPTGTIVTDTNGNVKNTFNKGENFKVLIPKSKLNENINGTIELKAKSENYPVFYGLSQLEGYQNYAVCCDPYGDIPVSTNLNINTNTGKIKIIKTDSETKKPIEGVTFQLSKKDGTIIANSTTNSKGEVTFSNLYQDNYILKELSTNKDYIIDEIEFEVNVEYNKNTTKEITNEHKRGNLKIYKVDKDNHKIAIGNVEFQLYSEEFDKIIGTYYTDVNGELEIKDLRTGNYKLIETSTNKWYNLADDTEVKLEWNETTETVIENELKKGQVKIIKIDKDNNEIKLEGVKFEVLDENGNVLETVTTDENGEAYTSKYPIRDYSKLIIRETETLENYELNDTPKTITLEENQIKNITFENEKIKGYIQITKYSSNNNKYSGLNAGAKLEGAVFEIYDSENNLVDTITTDKEGKAISKELLKGSYTLKEIVAPDYYIINENTFNAEIINHQEIVNVDITNDSVDIDVEITKTGFIETQCEDTIYYDFKDIKNNSNVPLDNFTWQDTLPTDAVRLEKIYTGTWNEDLEYSVWYKTNTSEEYKIFAENLSTNTNNELDFTTLDLADDEYVTDFEFRFGTVKVGYQEIDTPVVYCKVLSGLENGYIFTNRTKVSGTYLEEYVEDNDEWRTVIYDKDIELTETLPRTGM